MWLETVGPFTFLMALENHPWAFSLKPTRFPLVSPHLSAWLSVVVIRAAEGRHRLAYVRVSTGPAQAQGLRAVRGAGHGPADRGALPLPRSGAEMA